MDPLTFTVHNLAGGGEDKRRTGQIYLPGEPISPHLLRCDGLAVPSTASSIDASHLRRPRLVNSKGTFTVHNLAGCNKSFHVCFSFAKNVDFFFIAVHIHGQVFEVMDKLFKIFGVRTQFLITCLDIQLHSVMI